MTYWRDGSPTLRFALDTMRLFAQGGVEFLNDPSISTSFNNTSIASQYPYVFASSDSMVEAALTCNKVSRGGNLFLPLPAMHKEMSSGNAIAFFRPQLFRKPRKPDELRTELLLIWPRIDKSAAFRFERGLRAGDLHSYSHFQLSHSFNGGLIGFVETSLPHWLGNSLPATPVPTPRFSTWFSMLLSLSGHCQDPQMGLLKVFEELARFGSPASHQKASKVLARIVQNLVKGE